MDGYVDDLITLMVETSNSIIKRARNAIALAIHILFRPQNTNDPIHRDDVLILRKLLAEGRLEEQKVFLGWLIDTRQSSSEFCMRRPRVGSWILMTSFVESKAKNGSNKKNGNQSLGRQILPTISIEKVKIFTTGLRYEVKKGEQIEDDQKR